MQTVDCSIRLSIYIYTHWQTMDVSKRSTTHWWEDSQSMASQDGFYTYTGIYPSQANPLEVTPSSGYESPCSWTTNPTLQSQRRCSCGCMDPSSESSGNAGVVNFTLNCNVHLGTSPSNDQQKVAASSQYTIECSPEIFISPPYSRQPVATFVSPERYRKVSNHDRFSLNPVHIVYMSGAQYIMGLNFLMF